MSQENCVFCKIVKGDIPSYLVYESKSTAAFLDINPLNEGHILIVPKEHYQDIFDIDKEVLKELIEGAQKIVKRMEEVLGIKGVNLMNASGVEAEQSVLHFHLHIVPRQNDDNIDFNNWWQAKTKSAPPEKLKELAAKLRF